MSWSFIIHAFDFSTQLLLQPPGGAFHILAAQHRAVHRDGADPGSQDIIDIFQPDARNRHLGNRQIGDGGSILQSWYKIPRFGGALVNRPDANVVGPVQDRRPGLIQIVRADADDGAICDDPPGQRRRADRPGPGARRRPRPAPRCRGGR